jgi:hypothetical protein
VAEQVSELLNPDERSWNVAALYENLVPLDVAAALNIFGRPMSDTWSGERHGLCTVQSGYRAIAAVEAQKRAFTRGYRDNLPKKINTVLSPKPIHFGH